MPAERRSHCTFGCVCFACEYLHAMDAYVCWRNEVTYISEPMSSPGVVHEVPAVTNDATQASAGFPSEGSQHFQGRGAGGVPSSSARGACGTDA
eukprot:2620066-Pyramimonas_sp.AAC.1